jgi:prevent-host-death family protein
MTEVGIRALKQNASGVVKQVAAGEVVTITDRGRAVAQMSPLPASRLEQMLSSGQAQPARLSLADLGVPGNVGDLSAVLRSARDDDRF